MAVHCPQNQCLAQIPCGSGLARESGVSVTESLTESPPSQASQLPHWSCIAYRISARRTSPVGAGLPAMAVCQSLKLELNHCSRRQASSHIGYVLPTESAPGADPCGSGLARESGVSVTETLTEPPLSQASQLPHWSCIAHRISARRRSPVGAGLPAMAVCQSLNLELNHRLRRQASSHIGHALPTESAPGTNPLWERACPRWRCVSH